MTVISIFKMKTLEFFLNKPPLYTCISSTFLST